MSQNFTPPLSQLLMAAAEAVQAVAQGRSLTDALSQTDAALRPGAQALGFHAMRQLGWADAIAAELVKKSPGARFAALLRVALTLLKPVAEPLPGMPVYAPHTVVDQAVQAAAGERKLAPYKGLLNACLRRFLREWKALDARAADRPLARWNHPQWWVDRLKADYPEHWAELLAAANVPAPLTLRVNRRRASRVAVQAAFQAEGFVAEPVGEFGLMLTEPRPVTQLPGFEQGWWSVQDAGAQLAAPLLAPRDGMRVLDACAAPGGKTAHLLELADIDLLALDVDAARLERVGQNLDRLGLREAPGEESAFDAADPLLMHGDRGVGKFARGADSPVLGPGGMARVKRPEACSSAMNAVTPGGRLGRITLKSADAANLQAWWDGQLFDAVLADVPCTASGIVRRHPDIRWLRRADDVARTAALQANLADALWRVVAPGGRLLYATCSIFSAEGEAQARAFLARHPDARRLAAPGQLLPVTIHATSTAQHDGFFYALFAKPC